jgi:peroxiredoxin-like protein
MPVHEYPVSVSWLGGRDGSGKASLANSSTSIPLAVPPEFQGPGGATNPEELLTSAITGCYSITLGIVLANRKLPILSIEVEAVGRVNQQGANFTYTEIDLKPVIRLADTATEDQLKAAEDLAHKADNYCIVTNAVRAKVAVSIVPTVLRG